MEAPTLGTAPGPSSGRDAVHVAIAPVVAAEKLMPGWRVGRMPDGTFGLSAPAVGIVDPFLIAPVQPGERFWLLLYPNTVTSLRHVWTHPAFAPKPPEKGEADAP